ncbi:MAG: SDR family oxidoreductase [bacterium]|nr:SDR family oxidoreductase [bacterium]
MSETSEAKRILITGGGGYIGSVLTLTLLEAGHEVLVLDRFFFGRESLGPVLAHPNLELLKEDIRYVDPQLLEGIDVVVDLAGLSNDPTCDLDPEVTMDINHRGTLRFAALAKKVGVSRYIYSSSCSVYGSAADGPLDENSPVSPLSHYARCKALCDEALLEKADESFVVTILRNGTVFGLSGRMRFDLVVNLMTLTAHTSDTIYVLGGGKQWRPLIHIKDVARAFQLVMTADAAVVNGQVFNAGGNDLNYQVRYIAEVVKEIYPGITIHAVPDDADKRSYPVCFNKIAELLGFVPQYTVVDGVQEIGEALRKGTVSDGIKARTVEYYKYLLEAEQLLKAVLYDGRIF